MAFPVIPFLVQLAVSAAMITLSFILRPKVKTDKPEVQEFKEPKATAGTPIPVLFGTKELSGHNVLWYGNKGTEQYDV